MPDWIGTILNFSGVAAFIGSLAALYVALKRTPIQNGMDTATTAKDRADTIQILQSMVDEKAKELKEKQDSYIAEIASLRSELAEVKRLSQVPFRVVLEGITYPVPQVLKANIEILPLQKVVTVTQADD
jgi:hypothetical protein